MHKQEYEFYSNSSQIIVKNFNIKIKGDEMLIGEEKHRAKEGVFNLTLKKDENSKIAIDFVRSIPKKVTSVHKRRSLERNLIKITNPKTKATQSAAAAHGPSMCGKKTLTSLINANWSDCKKKFITENQHVSVGNIVMAKMKTYSPWPSRIDGITANGQRAIVYFFGSNNVGTVAVSEIVPLGDCHHLIKLLLLRKVSEFHKGVVQIERLLNIPPEMSLLKELEALL